MQTVRPSPMRCDTCSQTAKQIAGNHPQGEGYVAQEIFDNLDYLRGLPDEIKITSRPDRGELQMSTVLEIDECVWNSFDTIQIADQGLHFASGEYEVVRLAVPAKLRYLHSRGEAGRVHGFRLHENAEGVYDVEILFDEGV